MPLPSQKVTARGVLIGLLIFYAGLASGMHAATRMLEELGR